MATFYWTGAADGTWTNVGNWIESDGTTPAAPPGTGDSVVFDARSTRAITGSPSGTIRLAKVEIKHNLGTAYYIGTPTTPIEAAVDLFIVGGEQTDGGNPSGCQQICWDFGSSASGYNGTTARILRTNTTGLNGLEVVQLRGTHASNVLSVEGPSVVGWGTSFPGISYTVSASHVLDDNARVRLGSGGTLTTVNQTGGTLVIESAFTTLNQTSGTCRTEGTGAITTANVGGMFIGNSTGTITTLAISGNGVCDLTDSVAARTVTSATVNGPNARLLSGSHITHTNRPGALNGARTSQIDFGTARYVQQFATAS